MALLGFIVLMFSRAAITLIEERIGKLNRLDRWLEGNKPAQALDCSETPSYKPYDFVSGCTGLVHIPEHIFNSLGTSPALHPTCNYITSLPKGMKFGALDLGSRGMFYYNTTPKQ